MAGSVSSDEFTRMLAEMREAYLGELSQRFEEIESYILDAQKTDDFAELYESLYRAVHSIKGSAGTHGLHIISTVCHNLEDQLTEVSGDQSKVTEEGVKNWLAYLDLLEKARVKLVAGDEDFEEIELAITGIRHVDPEIKYSALMIEPSAMYAQMCEQVFTKHGISIASASDGYEALGRLLSEPFDVLITSMQIPRLDGLALIGALRLSSSRNSKIKTIMMTSKKEHEYIRLTDPNYVVEKNNTLMDSLDRAVEEIVSSLANKS